MLECGPEGTAFLFSEPPIRLAKSSRGLYLYPTPEVYTDKCRQRKGYLDKFLDMLYHASRDTSGVVWKECYMMQESLGHRLRVLRARRGLTLREAAARTGVAKETISDVERGIRHPHDVTLAKIADGYGVDVEELLEEPEVALSGPPKADSPPDTGPRSSPGTPRIVGVGPTGRGPNVTKEMLAELGIEANDAELNSLNIYLEGRARQRVEGGPTAIASLGRDNVDHEKVAGWAPVVEDALSNWIALGRFSLVPGTASAQETEAVQRHAREKLTELAQHHES
jgi:DNA-binding XRE family transcriptional regulator